MKKTTIATLFAFLATTSAIAGLEINEDYSKAEIKSSVQDDHLDDDDFFACTESDCSGAIVLNEEDWASYLKRNSSKIATAAIVAGVVAGGIYYLPIYLSGTAATSLLGKSYYAIFAMAGYAPKVIEKIVEVEKIVEREVEKPVFLGGGTDYVTEYVQVPVPVPVMVREFVGVQSQKAFEAAMNMAAKHFDYRLSAYSADGISHEARFAPRTWERIKALAIGYLSNPDGGIGSLRNDK